ncbi:polyprenyl synthetase family protein [Paenibacillus athensensis]|uniref:Polyprenyl synthetase n=1 Tax=Paenibacillus athensensis TaxID=1967502 RepID=A0A4Y8PX77_9BACL|nr:polyprenyl synthetase family protein [Paenibacillus athensensis]MCD1258878.1 polyprenyl synthetase family protein [Paenibacillus athensensis]
MEKIIQSYYPTQDLQELLLECIADKAAEPTLWSGMTLLVHRMLGGSNPHIDRLCALTELAILALDIMDDLQDQDNLQKVWMQRPQPYVLNAMVGLLMAVSAELSALRAADPQQRFPDAGEFGRLIAVAINGQQTDLALTVQTEHEYVEMVHKKSCMLIRIAFYFGLGALPKEAVDEDKEQSLYQIADHIGLMAQIRNDTADVTRCDTKNDLLGKKRTLPILFMLSDPELELPILADYYANTVSREQFAEQLDACLDYVQRSGCIPYCEFIQQLQYKRALDILKQLPLVAPWKTKFQTEVLDMFGG